MGYTLIEKIASFYDRRYPPTKFLRLRSPKLYVDCILAGYPRSGTHWVRNVVAKSSGLKTGNLYTQKPSASDQRIILLKVHARNKFIACGKSLWLLPRFTFGRKYLYIYRDPRDAIISYYEMYKRGKGVAQLKPIDFIRVVDPISQYRREVNAWVIRRYRDVLAVKFEELKLHPFLGYQKIFDFLGLECPIAKEYLGEMVAMSDSKHRPRGKAYGWRSTPSEYQSLVDIITSSLRREINLLGYPDK